MVEPVSRHARLWIETLAECVECLHIGVSRHARLWIETLTPYAVIAAGCASAATRGCGLKRQRHCAGLGTLASAATRGCGLKRWGMARNWRGIESAATRGCGLKRMMAVTMGTGTRQPPRAAVD